MATTDGAPAPPTSGAITPRTLALAGVVVATALLVVFTARILLVLFAGVLFAVFLRSITRWIAKRTHLGQGLILGVLVVVGIAGTAAALVALAPAIAAQIDALVHQVPPALDKARATLGHAAGPLGGAPPKASDLKLEPHALAAGAITALGTVTEILGGLVVVVFVGIYGAAQPDAYTRAVLWLTPPENRPRVAAVLDVTGKNLARWLGGRLIAMLFVGVTTGIAFAVLKLPLAGTLAVLAGFLTFVEYVGAVASAVLPVLFGFAQSPAVGIAVLVVYTILHVIEGYVLTPLLARASVHLPPAYTLAGQVVMEILVGPLGLTFSTPLLVVFVSAAETWRETGPNREATLLASEMAR